MKQHGPSLRHPINPTCASFPSDTRTQFWPLCCGATILSGLESEVIQLGQAELTELIRSNLEDYIPDFQVVGHMRQKCSAVVWLTLNKTQMSSPKLVNAVKVNGFVPVAWNMSMGGGITYFVRDLGGDFKLLPFEPKGPPKEEDDDDDDDF